MQKKETKVFCDCCGNEMTEDRRATIECNVALNMIFTIRVNVTLQSDDGKKRHADLCKRCRNDVAERIAEELLIVYKAKESKKKE